MATRANSSRERILTTAESIILQKGFASTSIEDILDQAAITKGGFFYHFEGKVGLAKALVERYLESDADIFTTLFGQADELSEDPLHQVLIFLKLWADMVKDLPEVHPGCLAASFTYESQQLNEEVRELTRQGFITWRQILSARLEKVVEKYPPKMEVKIEELADMFATVIEGGIILSRVFNDNEMLVKQLLSYRNYLRVLFEPQ